MRTDRDKRRLPAFLLVVSLIAGLLTGCVVTFEPVEEVQSVTTQPTTLPEPTETEPEPTEPPTEPVPPVTTTATITVTGDLLMHIPVINSAKEGKGWNFKPIFR